MVNTNFHKAKLFNIIRGTYIYNIADLYLLSV